VLLSDSILVSNECLHQCFFGLSSNKALASWFCFLKAAINAHYLVKDKLGIVSNGRSLCQDFQFWTKVWPFEIPQEAHNTNSPLEGCKYILDSCNNTLAIYPFNAL